MSDDSMPTNIMRAMENRDYPALFGNVSKKDVDEYMFNQLKEQYKKQPRKSGRPTEANYVIPLGIFNLGQNSWVDTQREADPAEENPDIEYHNNVRSVDGKFVYIDEDQKEDAELKNAEFNLLAKNDVPYHVFHTILEFGRLTRDELQTRFGAINPIMFSIIVSTMVNKNYLRFVQEKDRDIVFKKEYDPTDFNSAYDVVEKDIETLEVVSEEERTRVLEEKK